MKKKSKKRSDRCETYVVRVTLNSLGEYKDEYVGEDRQRAEEEYDYWCEDEEDCCVELIAEYQLKCRPCKAERQSK